MAYREHSGLLRLWSFKDIQLMTSSYALDEARRNLKTDEQRARLENLTQSVVVKEEFHERELPSHVDLPQKDRPILMAAIEAKANHLITGDFRDFGRYYGQTIEGVLILTPADYLKVRRF